MPNKSKIRPAIAVLLLLCIALPASAQIELWEGQDQGLDLNIVHGVWGGGLELAYHFLVPGIGQEASLKLGTALFLRKSSLYRNLDGTLFQSSQFTDPDKVAEAADFWQLHNDGWIEYFQLFSADFGIGLQLREYVDYTISDWSSASLFMQGSSFEKEQTFLLAGTVYAHLDTTELDKLSKVRSGGELLFGVEFSPVQASTKEKTAWLKTAVSGLVYLPLYSQINEELGRNSFSWYLGIRGILDYTLGLLPGQDFDGVPNAVRNTAGVRYLETGLGGGIRGLESSRFDSPFKAMLNIDSRFLLPAIFDKEIVPFALAFVDLGYYHDHWSGLPESSGFQASTGFGLGIHLLSLIDLHMYTSFLLFESNLRNEFWVPLSFGFTFHF